MQAVQNGLEFFSNLQLPPGNWGCEYGGPLFLLPGLVITWYVTETPIPESHRIEIINYIFARQTEEGGWGLHIEGDSSVFGTAMNYTTLRLLGVSPEDPRLIKARGLLHKLGGATNGPHWAKFWLSVLGVSKWEGLNPTPPELWYVQSKRNSAGNVDNNQVTPRLDSNISLEVVDSYASGFPSNGIFMVQKVVISTNGPYNGTTEGTLH